jgi:hypothetical protein
MQPRQAASKPDQPEGNTAISGVPGVCQRNDDVLSIQHGISTWKLRGALASISVGHASDRPVLTVCLT